MGWGWISWVWGGDGVAASGERGGVKADGDGMGTGKFLVGMGVGTGLMSTTLSLFKPD